MSRVPTDQKRYASARRIRPCRISGVSIIRIGYH
jgi:hypothetical protein